MLHAIGGAEDCFHQGVERNTHVELSSLDGDGVYALIKTVGAPKKQGIVGDARKLTAEMTDLLLVTTTAGEE